MGFLIDTNVLSEMRKQARANANVLRWAARNRASDLFLSALVIGEVRRGIEAARTRDAVQANSLDTWLATVIASFGPRILPITVEIADAWGRLSVPDRLPEVDGLLAATAIVHNLVLVTRNTRDVARTGVHILNPFDEPSPET
jgi:toxin FitB